MQTDGLYCIELDKCTYFRLDVLITWRASE
jgi:hypothetical protein